MAQPGDTIPYDRPEQSRGTQLMDAHSARGPASERPRPPKYRRGPAWVLAAVSLTTVTMGLMLPQGLLLATGLVTAAAAVHMFAPPRGHRPGRS